MGSQHKLMNGNGKTLLFDHTDSATTDITITSTDLSKISGLGGSSLSSTQIKAGIEKGSSLSSLVSTATQIDGKVIPIDTIALLRAKTTTPSTVWVSGYYTKGDGAFGSNIFEWDSTSTETDNGGTIIKLTSIATGRYKLKFGGAVTPEMFGAKEGVDSSKAIRDSDLFAYNNNYRLEFSGKDYEIQSELICSVEWIGVPGKTRIIAKNGFSHSAVYSKTGQTYTRIWNRNYNTSGYVSDTADTINISGIEFYREDESPTYTHWFTLRNVKYGSISNCVFNHADNMLQNLTNINLDGAVRNFTITKNYFRNETTQSTGTDIGVRNLSGNYSDDNNSCRDIEISYNTINESSGDEAIIVYSVFGLVENVVVENNIINTSNTDSGVTISVISDAPSGVYEPYAKVRNVIVHNNIITTNCSTQSVIRVTRSTDLANNVKNVIISSNTIYVTSKSNLLRVIECVISNDCIIKDNYIRINDSDYLTQTGIYGGDIVSNNKIYATSGLTKGIENSGQVIGNLLSVNSGGINNCKIILNNNITALVPISNLSVDMTTIEGNYITLLPATSLVNCIAVSNSTSALITNNHMYCNNATYHKVMYLYNNTNVSCIGNKAFGVGKTPSVAVKICTGNEYFGKNDKINNDQYLGYDFIGHLPYGHIIHKQPQTIDANGNIHLGWYKDTNNTLKAFYVKSTSTSV